MKMRSMWSRGRSLWWWAVLGIIAALIISGCGGPETTGTGGENTGNQTTSEGATAAPPAPEPDVSAYAFSPITFSGSASQYKSKWNTRVESLDVSLSGGALTASIKGGTDTSKNQYAGVTFPVSAPKALRLDMTFAKPDGIRVFYVDGYAAGAKLGEPMVRWEWRSTRGKKIPAGKAMYVLVPGKDSGYFKAVMGSDASSVQKIDVFAMVHPKMQVNFTINKVEVGK